MTERPHITSMSGRILSTVHRPDSGTMTGRIGAQAWAPVDRSSCEID